MNPIAVKLSPTATKMIRLDHAHVMAQFHKLTPETSESVRAASVRSICAALEIHAQIEEECFYPVLREANVESPVLEKSQPEHDEMRRLIEQVRAAEGQGYAQDEAVNKLMNAVLHHVADEETLLLPAAEKFLGSQRLSKIGAEMTARRMQLAKPRAGELVTDMARAAPAKTALVAAGALLAGSVLVSRMRRSRYVPRY